MAEIATEFGPQVMAQAGDGLWVSSVDSDAVQRIDPATNEPDPPLATEAFPDGLLVHGVIPLGGDRLRAHPPACGSCARGDTGTWVVSGEGAIIANQLVAEAGGAFWFPLLDAGEAIEVEVPV